MNLKKLGQKFHKVRKLGNKMAKKAALGMKKSASVIGAGSQVLATAGALTGQPELVAAGEAGMLGAEALSLGGSAVEKARTGDVLGAVREGKQAQKKLQKIN